MSTLIEPRSPGICVACDGHVEPELFFAQPTARICLECMEERERQALEDDLTIAQDVNRSLLPRRLPGDAQWEVGVHYRPSRILSGDFYDFMPRPEQSALALAVGDVAGKGIPAGLLRSGLQATLRTLSHEAFSPADVLSRANRVFLDSLAPGRFASVFYGVLDAARSRLLYANAGHNPPLLRRASGSIEKLKPTGTVLGAPGSVGFDEVETKLSPGDLLVLYTDGVTEAGDLTALSPDGVGVGPHAMNPNDRFYGEERLLSALGKWSSATVQEIANRIAEELDRFAPGEPSDDRTLVVFRERALSPSAGASRSEAN